MLDAFTLPFVQRGVLEVLLLSIGAGVLGTWIVLRGLSFFVHATGTAAFPGLVLADGLGFAAGLGALCTAALFALALTAIGRGRATGQDSLVAVLLVGFLAAGVILASDVFASDASVESLLFGSLLVIGTGDLLFAGVCSAAVVVVSLVLGDRWLARGFDQDAADALGVGARPETLALLALVAVTAVASLQAIGGLLVTALFVVPAATTRLLCDGITTWRLATIALAAAEGVGGLWLSVETNTPPGAAIAVVGGVVFAVVAAGRAARHKGAVVAAAAAALVLGGCGDQGVAGSGPRVVASTPIVADLAREVAGDDARVTALLRANTDPHDYEPRPQDVADTAEADVVLLSGGEVDAWMDDVVRSAGGDPHVVDLGRPASRTLDDPHWWHDPRNAVAAVGRIAESLARARPEGAEGFRARAQRYSAHVRAVDAAVERCFARVAPAQRKLVTDHDAFRWLALRYGIDVVGAVIPSRTTQAQASAGDLAELSRTIRRERVRAVFPESAVSADVARSLAARTGAVVGGEIHADSLGPADSRAGSYLGMLEANADVIVRGFTAGRHRCRGAAR